MPRSDTKIRSQLCSYNHSSAMELYFTWPNLNGSLCKRSQTNYSCLDLLLLIGYYRLLVDTGHTFSPLTRVVIENKLAVCDISALCCVISTVFLSTIACHGKQIMPLTAAQTKAICYTCICRPLGFFVMFPQKQWTSVI